MTSDHSGFVYEVGEWVPCPFCGAELERPPPNIETNATMFHPGVMTDTDCVLSGKGFYPEEREAWNRSAAPTPAELLEEEVRLRAQVRALKREVANKDRALHARNTALDGMAWVWCDGGCPGGVFRFCDMKLTDEMLAMIERNTARLKTWAKNREYRAPSGRV